MGRNLGGSSYRLSNGRKMVKLVASEKCVPVLLMIILLLQLVAGDRRNERLAICNMQNGDQGDGLEAGLSGPVHAYCVK